MRRQRGIATMLIVYAVGALAVIALFWWAVSAIEGKGYDRGIAECERRAKEQRDAEAKQAAGASTTLETGNAKAKVVFRTITRTVDKIVDRPIYRNVCFDDDGLRSANAALSGTLTPAGEPDKPVPVPDAARGGLRGLGPPQAGGGSGAVLRVQP